MKLPLSILVGTTIRNYTEKGAKELVEAMQNVNIIFDEMARQRKKISEVYGLFPILSSSEEFYREDFDNIEKSLKKLMEVKFNASKRIRESLGYHCSKTPESNLKNIEWHIEFCRNKPVNMVILNMMVSNLGYKFTEQNDTLLEKYAYIYSFLDSKSYLATSHFENFKTKYGKTTFETQAERLEMFMAETKIVQITFHCLFEVGLVRNGFRRDALEKVVLLLAQQIVQIDQMWHTVKLVQIKEIVENYPEVDVEMTNISYSKIAEKIYIQQQIVGNPEHGLQILVVPYSSEDINQNPNFWFYCKSDVCQLFQMKNYFNVLVIRAEPVKGNGLQDYVNSVRPTVIEAFERKYIYASTPRNVFYNLKRQENVDITKFEHHQGVIIIRSQRYFRDCYQTMVFYPRTPNNTTSIHTYFDAKGYPFRYCQSWFMLFV